MDVDLDVVLAAIADPTRRTLLQRLAYGAATTGQLAELLPMSRPAVSQHIKVLQDAGLIHTAVRGRHRWHELVVERLTVVDRWTAGLTARHAAMHPEKEPR
ncbi:metalloregulator ArsR/SmtB family transcription factor [Dactylosporangium sp. NPDC049525]|uniref:ArsR/SmtB family transcription factor n=1 Tax=Dactylosporangium sp. NPDC049525 TaxID=3154730 RepID=UPI00342BC37E